MTKQRAEDGRGHVCAVRLTCSCPSNKTNPRCALHRFVGPPRCTACGKFMGWNGTRVEVIGVNRLTQRVFANRNRIASEERAKGETK